MLVVVQIKNSCWTAWPLKLSFKKSGTTHPMTYSPIPGDMNPQHGSPLRGYWHSILWHCIGHKTGWLINWDGRVMHMWILTVLWNLTPCVLVHTCQHFSHALCLKLQGLCFKAGYSELLVAMYQVAQHHTPADNFLVTTVRTSSLTKGKCGLLTCWNILQVEMAHKVLSKDMGELVNSMKLAQSYSTTTLDAEYRK